MYTERWVVYYDKMATGSKTFDDANDAAVFANSRQRDQTFKLIKYLRAEEVSLPVLLQRWSKKEAG